MFMAACVSDKSVDGRGSGDYKAEITSFGFYAEDNAGVLVLDYEGEITGCDIVVALPESVDKTQLKARFTVSDGDIVSVGDEIFESGSTVYDYSSPVDMLVSDSESKYAQVFSVNITKPVNKVWTHVGTLKAEENEFTRSDFKMKLNPVDQLPYLVYCVTETASDEDKLAFAKWDGSEFVRIGEEAFSTEVGGAVDLEFDTKGTPFVLYADRGASVSNAPTVMTYDGSAWKVVGTSGFIPYAVNTSHGALAVDATGRIVVVTTGNGRNTEYYRLATLSSYSGSGWTSGVIPNRPTTYTSTYYQKARRFGESVYIGVANVGTGGFYSLYKWTNGSVSTLVESGLTNSSATNWNDLAIDFADDGTMYFLSSQQVDGAYLFQVYTYKDGEDSAPRPFGASVPTTRFGAHTMALDRDGVPYIVYTLGSSGARYLQVVSYDREQRKWLDPVTVDVDNEIASEGLFIAFDDENVGYLGAMGYVKPYEFRLYKLLEVESDTE